jgi:uncharacterized repeat protein (TIGR03803 family)
MHRFTPFRAASFFVVSIVISSALPRPALAQAYEVLHAFEQAPRDSRGEMCVKDGELYGVTLFGGDHDEGTLFKVTSDGRIEVLHSFGGAAASMRMPWGGLIWVPSADGGAFFGTTAYGGTNDLGTVFRMRPGEVPEAVHSFSGADGRYPQSTLLAASDGYVYGATSYGGSGSGTLFRFDSASPAATFQAFHGFSGGIVWQGEITEAPDGLYVAPYLTSGYSTGEVQDLDRPGSAERHTLRRDPLDERRRLSGLPSGRRGQLAGSLRHDAVRLLRPLRWGLPHRARHCRHPGRPPFRLGERWPRAGIGPAARVRERRAVRDSDHAPGRDNDTGRGERRGNGVPV